MLSEITEKIIGENAFEQKKKNLRLNLTLGWALVGFEQLGPGHHASPAAVKPHMNSCMQSNLASEWKRG